MNGWVDVWTNKLRNKCVEVKVEIKMKDFFLENYYFLILFNIIFIKLSWKSTSIERKVIGTANIYVKRIKDRKREREREKRK